ncbi:MAG: 2-oxo acid dehydrogenase subunit E2 [Candidatus Kapaibacterium sp.]
MASNKPAHKIVPFPKIRRATTDLLKSARRKNMIHSFIEVDVTDARRMLRRRKRETGEFMSLLGFIIYCVARAVEKNPKIQAYRNRKNQLVIFEDVDVSTTIERTIDGNKEVVAMVLRRANDKSASEISTEIRDESAKDAADAEVMKSIKLYLAIPAFLRNLAFRLIDRAPFMLKQKAGTIMVTSANMVGSGAAWGLPIASHTLGVTIGGIARRAAIIGGEAVEREHLCLTLSLDHDIIDGAPAARFIRRLKQLIEHPELG